MHGAILRAQNDEFTHAIVMDMGIDRTTVSMVRIHLSLPANTEPPHSIQEALATESARLTAFTIAQETLAVGASDFTVAICGEVNNQVKGASADYEYVPW